MKRSIRINLKVKQSSSSLIKNPKDAQNKAKATHNTQHNNIWTLTHCRANNLDNTVVSRWLSVFCEARALVLPELCLLGWGVARSPCQLSGTYPTRHPSSDVLQRSVWILQHRIIWITLIFYKCICEGICPSSGDIIVSFAPPQAELCLYSQFHREYCD